MSVFEFYHTLWGKITPNKLILVKIRLQKVVMGEVQTQKVQENFKKCSCFNTIVGPLSISHPVYLILFVAIILLMKSEVDSSGLPKSFTC